jgi:hypothetical protein
LGQAVPKFIQGWKEKKKTISWHDQGTDGERLATSAGNPEAYEEWLWLTA